MIEGLTQVTGPSKVNRGHLQLPDDFDETKFVGFWAKRGSIANKAKQDEILGGSGVKAQGWNVWKSARGQLCQRTLSSGVYVLMFRPKSLQQAVQKIYGNESRRRMLQEAMGETVAGEAVTDTVVLTDKVLSQIPGLGRE